MPSTDWLFAQRGSASPPFGLLQSVSGPDDTSSYKCSRSWGSRGWSSRWTKGASWSRWLSLERFHAQEWWLLASNCGALGGDGLRRLYLQRWKHCVQEKAVSHTEVSSKAASSGHLLSSLCQRKQGGASGRTRRASNKAGAEVEKVEENSKGSKKAEGQLRGLEGWRGCGRRLCIGGRTVVENLWGSTLKSTKTLVLRVILLKSKYECRIGGGRIYRLGTYRLNGQVSLSRVLHLTENSLDYLQHPLMALSWFCACQNMYFLESEKAKLTEVYIASKKTKERTIYSFKEVFTNIEIFQWTKVPLDIISM